MQRARSRALRLVMILGAACAAGNCSKDDIPTTPPGPFLITDVAISKIVTPPTTSVLHPGTAYVARFAVDYTLDPDTDAQRSLYTVFADVAEFDANDSLIDAIGFIPFPPPVLTAASGVVSDSISFTVPTSGTPYIRLIAGIALRTANSFSFRRGPRWSVH